MNRICSICNQPIEADDDSVRREGLWYHEWCWEDEQDSCDPREPEDERPGEIHVHDTDDDL